MTQKEIKELIKADEKRLLDIREGYKNVPEYQKNQKEIAELLKKKFELEEKQEKIQANYLKEVEDEIKFAKEELVYSNNLLRDLQIGIDPKEQDDGLKNMFKAFYAGSTWGDKKKIQWVSEDGCYAIFKVESHSSYTGRFSGSVNSEASWCLFFIDPEFNDRRLEPSSHLCIWDKSGGRWGEKRDMKIIREVINNYETNVFMENHMKSLGFELKKRHYSNPHWENEKIIIKYTTESKSAIGFDKGNTIVNEHVRICTLVVGSDYYIDMPTNEEEFEKKYPNIIKEIKENQ